MVVIWLPVLLLFFMFVVDVGNWFVHKRHLQMQADAGALAGGSVFRIPCSDTPILDETHRYGGDAAVAGAYNLQIAPTQQANVHLLVNSTNYWNKGGSDFSDVGMPCAAKFVDVKMTEANLPWFMRLAVVPAINAHARVSILQKESASGALPVGVPDNNPAAGAAIFVDESNNNVLAIQPLTKAGSATMNGVSLTEWASTASSVTISSARTGVVIALSGIASWSPSGTLSQICGQVLVECYDGDGTGPWTGLSFIHGYSTAGIGTPIAPIVRDVTLANVSCTDGSGPYFLLHAGCSVGVRAKIDFGPVLGGNPSLPPAQGGLNAQLKVSGWSCPTGGQAPKGCNMTYHTSGPDAGYWTTDGSNGYPVMPADGVAHSIDLNWGTNVATRVSGTLTGVQRSYSAGAGSDPVEYVTVSELGPGANSFAIGSSHSLSVDIGVLSSLQQNSTDPNAVPVALKVLGSQNQAIDCDPAAGTNMRYELANGCTPTYTINKGTPCLSYQYYSTLPQTADWACTRTQTGGSVGQVSQGMLDRTQGGLNTCVNPINWKDVNGDGLVTIPEDIPPDDPRIMPVFVTPFGSFSGSGNDVIPITNFATFYVTGFSKNGGGQGDPCPGADPVPNKTGGYIVGHFIKYVETVNTGGGGGPCDFNSFGTCVAVLTD